MLSFLLAENKKIFNSLQFCNSINGVQIKLRQLLEKLHIGMFLCDFERVRCLVGPI